MISAWDLMGEIDKEAKRRAEVNQRLRSVRLNPETFWRMASDLKARVQRVSKEFTATVQSDANAAQGDEQGEFIVLHTACGGVVLLPDAEAVVIDHPYFDR